MGASTHWREAGDFRRESTDSGEAVDSDSRGGCYDNVADLQSVQRDSGGGRWSARRIETVAGRWRGIVGEAYKESERGTVRNKIDKRIWAYGRHNLHLHISDTACRGRLAEHTDRKCDFKHHRLRARTERGGSA